MENRKLYKLQSSNRIMDRQDNLERTLRKSSTVKAFLYCTLAAITLYTVFGVAYHIRVKKELEAMPLSTRVETASRFVDGWHDFRIDDKIATWPVYITAKQYCNNEDKGSGQTPYYRYFLRSQKTAI